MSFKICRSHQAKFEFTNKQNTECVDHFENWATSIMDFIHELGVQQVTTNKKLDHQSCSSTVKTKILGLNGLTIQ
jgi:hypothetical protein